MSKELNQKPWQWVKLAHGATGVQMSCRHLVITCLLVSSVGVTARQTTTTLATKGEISVTTADVRANNPLMTDVDYQSLLQNPSAFRKNVEDVANARVAAIKLDRMAKSYDTPNEAAAFQVARERSVMSTALAMAERDGRVRAAADKTQLAARAREIYDNSDAQALQTPLMADIQVILFDITQRPFSETLPRIEDVTKALNSAKSNFSDVAMQYSDDQKSASSGGKVDRVSASNMSDVVSREVFDRLKPNDVSRLLPHPRGLVLVKLIKLHPQVKKTYDDLMREASIKRAEVDAGQAARELRRKEILGDDPLIFNEDALNTTLIQPDTNALKLWREQEARKQAKTPVSSTPATAPTSAAVQ